MAVIVKTVVININPFLKH